jgi:hypothetical protein
MPSIASFIRHTPWWAFGCLAIIVALGIQALKTRTIPLWRIIVVPAVFIVWGVVSLALRWMASPVLVAGWVIAGAAGFAVARLTTRLEGVRVDPSRVRVHVPGSAEPLVRNLVIFSAKYCLTAAMIIAPTLHDSLARWDILVSGISAGYFIGGLLRLVIKIRGAGQPKSEALIA